MNNSNNNPARSKLIAVVIVLLFVVAPMPIGFITGKGVSVALFSMAAVFAVLGWLIGSRMTQNQDANAKLCTMPVNAVVVDNKVEVVQSRTWDDQREVYVDSTINSYTPVYEYTDQYGAVHRRTYYTSHGAVPVGTIVTIYIDPNDPERMIIPGMHESVQSKRRGFGMVMYGIAAMFAFYGVVLLLSGH